jgi:putative ATPase
MRFFLDIFESGSSELLKQTAPLADRMRPRVLSEYIGQNDIIGKGRLLRRAIEADRLSSLIFYGPPGSGKTTLARVIANSTKASFITINAVLAGVKEIREGIQTAKNNFDLYSKRTILFVDEVHRFNKSQQDALLPHVENGIIILIGATTENPYFEVNKALVSRSRIFQLSSLTTDNLEDVMVQAIKDNTRGYGNKNIEIDRDAIDHLCKSANGDARSLLNALELAVETTTENSDGVICIDNNIIAESIQKKAVLYDKDGDSHYDTISAFIKSIRGSDPDASLYWLAKMIYAGEDPRFIFRRLVILASEDIGLADPNALSVVMSASQSYDFIGMPEGRFPLSQAVLYLATAPKSNTTLALFDALSAVEKEESGDVPDHLKDGSRDRDDFGHGEGYLYPHAFRDHWVSQQYLPSALQGRVFYQPSDQGYEKGVKELVERRRDAQIATMMEREQEETFLWQGGENGRWELRSSDGGYFEELRDSFFNLLALKRGDLILDLNCGTGLFTFESLRQSPDGAVFSMTENATHFDTIKGYSSSIGELERPNFLLSSYNDLVSKIDNAEFTAIIGRNVISSASNIEDLVNFLSSQTSSDSKFLFSEYVPSLTTRISSFLQESDLKNILISAENNLFSDKKNRLASFSPNDFIKLMSKNGVEISKKEVAFTTKKRFRRSDVNQWFVDSENVSLGGWIKSISDEKTAMDIKGLLLQELLDRDVEWSTVSLFIRINKII